MKRKPLTDEEGEVRELSRRPRLADAHQRRIEASRGQTEREGGVKI